METIVITGSNHIAVSFDTENSLAYEMMCKVCFENKIHL